MGAVGNRADAWGLKAMADAHGTRLRLDQHLVSLGLFDSRAQAAAAIKVGQVFINGTAARKASQSISANDTITAQAAHGYVSRGGLKLDKGLNHFGYHVADRVVVDVGASTGGFSDVLLQNNVGYLYALDVGHGQLHERIAANARVSNLEKHNAREAVADWFDRPLDALVCDVSFISLKLALDNLLHLINDGGWALILVKPQFEVGKAALGKNGVVGDAALHQSVCDDIVAWLNAHSADWQVDGVIESPITGPQGNVEFLLGAQKNDPQC